MRTKANPHVAWTSPTIYRLASQGLVVLTTGMVLGLLIWLGWTGQQTRNDMRAASLKEVRVAELLGTITYLDEWLTMSAQMAAASGERRWVDRYEEAVPKLDAAVADAADLATAEVRTALVSTTEEAHRDLVTMERHALALASTGNLAPASALLNGPEFAYIKDVYATGIEVFSQELKTIADERAADLNDRAWMEAAGLGVGVVLLVATGFAVRGHTRFKGAMARIAAATRTDALTDLPNRRHFFEDLGAALANRGLTDDGHALLLVDLDRFKATNDAYGHPAGDQLLQLVASRLRGAVRAGDLIARLGGDEFALVVRCDGDRRMEASDEPAMVANRVVNALSEPFALADGVVAQIGGSIGIALAHAGRQAVDDLMHQAEVALYRAKADGRGRFRFFEHGMDVQVRERARLEGELRQAVVDDWIVPHFQPLVAIETGQIIGVEMLARWPHPVRGMVSPAEFIPIAEDLGLIGAMTERLMVRACRAAANWPKHVILACNISPLQLRDLALPAMIRTILDETGFPASRLELEVTESALVGDVELAHHLLNELKALGVGLAIDDFGTGYSSLRHLQTLPFDKIKIDRSFVGEMAHNKESGKIVSAVIGLGRSLGLSTVAEGVETKEVETLLRELGCDVGQGWLFGRPAPAEGIDELVLKSRQKLIATAG